ncbi:early estrogen-induced gene 1 protein-like, partial [Saccoglossus kowalevskii]|uniref:Protein FAM102A-like n=1 Tax=Saccoglossus kowalevskii TaxID=10224 RepID=A0ABM0GSP4_SACKO
EVKGGKSFVKLGFVDLNLAEYAGASNKSRRYLLEGYDSKQRQDNSILKVTIGMTLLSGDPCFKAPDVKELFLPGELPQDERMYVSGTYKSEDFKSGGGSIASFGSSASKPKTRPCVTSSSWTTPEHEGAVGADDLFTKGHSRSSSCNSQHSRGGSTHSRSSSTTEPFSSGTSINDTESSRNSWTGSTERRRKEDQNRRVDCTRINADELIANLIKQQDFTADNDNKSGDEEGLQLFIAKDGSTALGSQQIKNRMTAGAFEKVVIDKR